MEYTIEKIMEENENDNYENYKKDVVSMISYLIGVKESSLKQEKNFNQKIINDLDNNEDAKIIHALCTLRTEYIKNFKEITNRRRNLEPIESRVCPQFTIIN